MNEICIPAEPPRTRDNVPFRPGMTLYRIHWNADDTPAGIVERRTTPDFIWKFNQIGNPGGPTIYVKDFYASDVQALHDAIAEAKRNIAHQEAILQGLQAIAFA